MRLIEVENVSKIYRARSGPRMLLARGGFINLFGRRTEKVAALQDISFTVEQGEALGIIGANGSGKSTLLKLLAGVTVPTTGRVEIYGRVASLLELGAGFHPLLTGRENIYLNARILGVGRARVDAMFDQIVEFSGIGEFLDNPVNTYSSGMFVRLGFAVAVHVDPDVFLVDEVLSVGDEEFQRKCRTRIGELREQGKTIVFVSHDLGIVNTLCTRVLLLSKGKMISRGTPRETIDFYLRQIGREVGIHTFAEGRTETIFCHGRISVFHNQREVTAARGGQMYLECLGQGHESWSADWTVVERRPTGCTARGRMSRLPVILEWDLHLEGDRLVWHMAMECEQEIALSLIKADLFLPTTYERWIYGDLAGSFPGIAPGDLNWAPIMALDPDSKEAGAAPTEGAPQPPMFATLETDNPYLCLMWANSDYVTGSRVLQTLGRIPDADMVFAKGRHELMTLEVNLGLASEQVQEAAAARVAHRAEADRALRTVRSGRLAARFDDGWVHYVHDDTEITKFLHFYASAHIASLWNDSHDFQWQPPQRSGERLLVSGESRRFPYREHWEIEAVPEGIATGIWIEPLDPLDVRQYHASIVLRPEYSHWQTDHESGRYPDFEPGQEDWRHANRLYAPGTFAKATSALLPSVTLRVTSTGLPFRMTPINTGFHQNARVLQALRTPEAGLLHFEKGRHLYFAGIVSVNPDERHK